MAQTARINPEGIRKYLKGYASGGPVAPFQETWVEQRDREAAETLAAQPAGFTAAPANGQETWIAQRDREAANTLAAQPAGFTAAPANGQETWVAQRDREAANALAMKKPLPFKRPGVLNLGFANSGRIPGKVNPNVADDVTIDAKKGEYVLPVEVVGAMGGPDAIDAMVKNIKTKMGMPAETGPKMRSEPDAQGRMNARGMRGFAEGGDVNPDKMYIGNGPLSQSLRRFRNNPPTPAGVPTGYDRAMNIADNVGATLKSWGREAQPELAGQDTGVWNTNVVQGIKNWDAKQRNPDAVTATHDNLNLSSDFAVAPTSAPVQPTPAAEPDRTPIDWTKAGADAVKAVGGFGKQPVGEVVASSEDEASRLAARNTQYAATAADAAGTDAREAFGAKVSKERTAVADTAATKDRIGLLNSIISNNGRPEYVQAAKLELASILGQQQVGLKEAEISAGLEKENILGGFGLKEQALRNEGAVAAENVRGGFASKTKELDPSQIAENNARATLLTKQAEGTLSKKEQIELAAANKQAEILQNQKKLGADAYTKTFAETGDPMKAADAQMAVEAALSGDTFVPGTQAQKGTFRFGFGKPKIDATAGKIIKKGEVDVSVAQKLMAKYGNDPTKARAAYAAGER